MRRLFLLSALLLSVPFSLASTEPYVILADWRDGTILTGSPIGIDGANRATIDIAVPACQREILLDLLYAPQNASAETDQAAVALVFDWTAALTRNGANLAAPAHVTGPGYGYRLGVAPAAGNYSAAFFLRTGALVDWHARVRGHEVWNDPACATGP